MPEVECGLCQCGCGARTTVALKSDTRKGLVKGRPRRFLHGHNRRIEPPHWLYPGRHPVRTVPAFRWVEVDAGYLSPCWLWTGKQHKKGYGLIQVRGKRQRAHRYVYEQLVGPIPEGLEIDHLCRNKPCVNPDHLEPVTLRENLRRYYSGWKAEAA